MTHTILIHQAFASNDEPGGTRHYELGRRLVAQGQRFTVITSEFCYSTGDRVKSAEKCCNESPHQSITIRHARTFSATHKSYFLRVLSFLSFMVTSVVAGISAGRPDVVMGTTPPIFQALSAWMLAAIRRSPFLLEVRDLWPDFAIDIGLLKSPLLIGAARRLESFLYAHAGHILVNSPAYVDYLAGRGVEGRKISLIANGVDPEMFDPEEHGEAVRQRYGLGDKFVVTYAGAIGMANDIDVLVKAAAIVKCREDLHILVVGDGKERKRLENRAQELELTNLTFTGAVPKSQMDEVLAASNACVAILRNIETFAMTYPNKVFDYMAAGRPTILAIDGVIRAVVEAADGGIFVHPGDAEELARAIVYAADHRERAREMGAHGRAYVEKHFNRDEHARKFAGLIVQLASGELHR